MQAVMLGIPLNLGANNLDVALGPDAFRDLRIVEKLRGSSIDVTDLGNIKCTDRKKLVMGNPKLKYLDEILKIATDTASVIEESARKKNKVIGIGGDHSVTQGLFSGLSAAMRGEIGMIYFDAHGDMNTDATTKSGNIHGMHLAALMGFGNKKLVNVYKQGKKLAKENLIHIGGCDFDEAELDLSKRERLKTFQIDDLLVYGLAPLFGMIDALQRRVAYVYVSLDLDSINSHYAPGAGMPNKGGLTYREIVAIANYIGKHCNVAGVDVVEYNPLQDVEHKTAELGIELIARFFGKNYSWYTNYLKNNEL